MHHVIIGAGPAGVTAAETLRRTAAGDRVTLIDGEPGPPYSRMAIPYLLIDDIDEQGTSLRKRDDHFQALGIELLNDRVERIDSGGRQLSLAGGARLGYDRLLIASGATPVRPPVEGMDAAGVHTCWTLDDARSIHALARPGARVLLMGAGFIGCIILEALASSGAQLTVVEMGERMVPRMLDATAGRLLQRWCEERGTRVHTGTQVTAITPVADGLRATLDSGETVDVDLVVCATGVRPSLGFLAGTGVQTDIGVLVDEHLQSSVEHIYAAGDVAQALDLSTGEHSVQAIQPTAVEHGRIAALNMAGHTTAFSGSLNMNVLDTLGLVSTSFGLWMGVDGGDSATLLDEARFRYLQLQFRGDVLVGAQSLGHTEHVGVLRGLIQTARPLGAWKARLVADPTCLMEAYLATAQDTARVSRVA